MTQHLPDWQSGTRHSTSWPNVYHFTFLVCAAISVLQVNVILEHLYVCTLNAFSLAVAESYRTEEVKNERSEEADSLLEAVRTDFSMYCEIAL